jgi:hypothetical protein
MLNLKKQKIAILDHTTTPQRRAKVMVNGRPFRNEHGKEVIERAPWQPFLKVVKLSGAVSRVPLSTHRAINERQDPYRAYMEFRKPRTGMIPYGACPQTMPPDVQAFIPEELLGRQPCRAAANGKPISNENCCPCIEELITYRKAEQAREMSRIEQKTGAQLQAEAAVGLTTAVKDMAIVQTQMAQVVASLSPPAPKRGKASDE